MYYSIKNQENPACKGFACLIFKPIVGLFKIY
nr:MAG TPA: hypothetical protein [Caudoviricetes sp.]